MEDRTKEVDFHSYCSKCKFEDVKEDEEPCHDCLNHPWNVDSHKPWEFKEK